MTDTDTALLDAISAVAYAIDKLPPSGSRMSQAAERRCREALAMLDAALAAASPPPLDVERLARAIGSTANAYEPALDRLYEWWITPNEFAAAIARAYAAQEGKNDEG